MSGAIETANSITDSAGISSGISDASISKPEATFDPPPAGPSTVVIDGTAPTKKSTPSAGLSLYIGKMLALREVLSLEPSH